MSINALQSRMARAALGWSIKDAATKAHVGTNTLSRFECGGEAYISTARALLAAYQTAGVEFVGDGIVTFAGLGVQLKAEVGA